MARRRRCGRSRSKVAAAASFVGVRSHRAPATKVAAAVECAEFAEFVVERTDSIAHLVPAGRSCRSETIRETLISL